MKALCLSLILGFVSLNAEAYPMKFKGYCQEVGHTTKSEAMVGIDFSSFPNSLELINENGKITHAEFHNPIKMNPLVDQYVVLEKITTIPSTKFSLIYYGSAYSDSPYFYEMTVSYDLDASGFLKTHQLQTTYYQGKASTGNEWVCEYQEY